MRSAERVTLEWTSGEDFPDHVEVTVNGKKRVYVDRTKQNQLWCTAVARTNKKEQG